MCVTVHNRASTALLTIIAALSLAACGGSGVEPIGSEVVDTRKGILVVMAHVRGNSVDRDGFTADIGSTSLSVDPSTPAQFSLSPGAYTVNVGGLAEHCAADAHDVQAIVSANKTDTVNVGVTCIGGLAYLEKTAPNEFQIDYLGQDGRSKMLTVGPGQRANLVWSPDSLRIFFTSDVSGHVHLYSVQVDGSGLKQLTAGNTEDGRPYLSPDGARIAYTTKDVATQSSSIVVMNADGSSPHTLPATPSFLDLAWSADGSQLYFSCSVNGGNITLCASAPDGSGLRAIAVPAIDALYAECTTSTTCVAPSPRGWQVSPDGRKISFITARSPSLGPSAVWISAIDGSGAKTATLVGALSFGAQWSPTSDWLTLGVYRDPPDPNPFAVHGSGIATVKADGSGYRMLSPGWIDDISPAISPDGTLIAFQNGNAIVVMNPDGTGRHNLTAHGSMSLPVWNPKVRPSGQ
jgi:Tol biopolymer transport system component